MSLRSLCRSNDRLDCRGRLLVQRLAYQRLQQSDADGMRPRRPTNTYRFAGRDAGLAQWQFEDGISRGLFRTEPLRENYGRGHVRRGTMGAG